MARIDRSTGRLVVRLAYDGAPLAGKTASLRALGAEVDAPVRSFDEAYGRTLWFDWMTHRGGMYRGRPIECEVAAVPGQRALDGRRRAVLADADAVVFVADTSPAGRTATLDAWTRLARWTDAHPAPPGVVVQANKRDLPGAATVGDLRRWLLLPADVPVVESVATDRVGIRHAFVFGIRAAVRCVETRQRDGDAPPLGDGPRTAEDVRRRMAPAEGVRS